MLQAYYYSIAISVGKYSDEPYSIVQAVQFFSVSVYWISSKSNHPHFPFIRWFHLDSNCYSGKNSCVYASLNTTILSSSNQRSTAIYFPYPHGLHFLLPPHSLYHKWLLSLALNNPWKKIIIETLRDRVKR